MPQRKNSSFCEVCDLQSLLVRRLVILMSHQKLLFHTTVQLQKSVTTVWFSQSQHINSYGFRRTMHTTISYIISVKTDISNLYQELLNARICIEISSYFSLEMKEYMHTTQKTRSLVKYEQSQLFTDFSHSEEQKLNKKKLLTLLYEVGNSF